MRAVRTESYLMRGYNIPILDSKVRSSLFFSFKIV